jgi:hypothetical protein
MRRPRGRRLSGSSWNLPGGRSSVVRNPLNRLVRNGPILGKHGAALMHCCLQREEGLDSEHAG